MSLKYGPARRRTRAAGTPHPSALRAATFPSRGRHLGTANLPFVSPNPKPISARAVNNRPYKHIRYGFPVGATLVSRVTWYTPVQGHGTQLTALQWIGGSTDRLLYQTLQF